MCVLKTKRVKVLFFPVFSCQSSVSLHFHIPRKRGRLRCKNICVPSVTCNFWAKVCVVWLRKRPASEWGSLWESSSFVPWFSTFVFRNVPGTVPECVRICEFKKNLSNLDRAPKMRDSVLLHCWDSFLVTLPSTSSKTCVIYSSLILGTDVFPLVFLL